MVQNKIYQLILVCLALLVSHLAVGQQKTDTLIINVGKSKIIFLIQDKKDLAQMEQYDLNEILAKLKMKLENDSTLIAENEQIVTDTTIVYQEDKPEENTNDRWENNDRDANDRRWADKKQRRSYTRNLFNFDLGINNYANGSSENNSNHDVRPWGSWYFGINSTYQTTFNNRFYIEWGPGISWYNFKFENERMRITEIGDQTVFIEDTNPDKDYKKSKLTASFINFSAVPMFQFGNAKTRKNRSISRWSDWNDFRLGQPDAGLRLGVGGYAGYRLGSFSKVKFEGGKKDKDRDNFNLNNFRYGVRLQVGFRGTDLFFNYDLNELFATDKGPKLNAFSFGIIL